MNREYWKKLADNVKQVKVAELDGWTQIVHPKGLSRGDKGKRILCCLPDYLNDLNAMHDAWQRLTYLQQVTYTEILASIVCETDNRNDWVWMDVINAIAAQRAEAFVLTLSENTKGEQDNG